MHNQRISIIAAAIVGIIATFLPFMKSWIYSVTLIETQDGTGYIIIIAFVISLIVALLGNREKAIVKGHLAGTIIPGIIPALLILIIALSRLNDDLAKLLTNYEIGFYLVIITSLSIVILGLILNDTNSIKSVTNQDNEIFCSGCGKQHSYRLSGQFCDECGTKL